MSAKDATVLKVTMGRWIKLADDKLAALARQSVQELAETVVNATPVDTGFLRGSWQPSIGEPAAAAGHTDPAGAASMSLVAAEIIKLSPGERFYMMNNAAYARRLEFGFVGEDSLGRHYDQKGRFYVSGSIAKWPQIVKKVAADLGFKA
ncbi:MAG TPA: hypothetical protein VI229_00405 [Burkholderiales bacterium]